MKGEQVYLRELEPHDVDVLYEWENDPGNWRVSGTISPFSRTVLKEYVHSSQDIYATGQLRLMICDLRDDRQVGAIDLFDHDPNNRRAGVGILIGKKEDRENGYAKDALALLIEYSFDTLGLHQLYCNIMAENDPSFKLFKKFGFQRVGVKKEWIRTRDGWKDEVLLQLIDRR